MKSGPALIPPQHAAMLMPVAEHDTLRRPAIHGLRVHLGSMGMPMHHQSHIVLFHGFLNRRDIDVGNFFADGLTVRFAVDARLGDERTPLCH